jgi:hypothetical protein
LFDRRSNTGGEQRALCADFDTGHRGLQVYRCLIGLIESKKSTRRSSRRSSAAHSSFCSGSAHSTHSVNSGDSKLCGIQQAEAGLADLKDVGVDLHWPNCGVCGAVVDAESHVPDHGWARVRHSEGVAVKRRITRGACSVRLDGHVPLALLEML